MLGKELGLINIPNDQRKTLWHDRFINSSINFNEFLVKVFNRVKPSDNRSRGEGKA